jgi:hypothetical protein
MQRKFYKYSEDPNLILTLTSILSIYDDVFSFFCFKHAYGGEKGKLNLENVQFYFREFYKT